MVWTTWPISLSADCARSAEARRLVIESLAAVWAVGTAPRADAAEAAAADCALADWVEDAAPVEVEARDVEAGLAESSVPSAEDAAASGCPEEAAGVGCAVGTRIGPPLPAAAPTRAPKSEAPSVREAKGDCSAARRPVRGSRLSESVDGGVESGFVAVAGVATSWPDAAAADSTTAAAWDSGAAGDVHASAGTETAGAGTAEATGVGAGVLASGAVPVGVARGASGRASGVAEVAAAVGAGLWSTVAGDCATSTVDWVDAAGAAGEAGRGAASDRGIADPDGAGATGEDGVRGASSGSGAAFAVAGTVGAGAAGGGTATTGAAGGAGTAGAEAGAAEATGPLA